MRRLALEIRHLTQSMSLVAVLAFRASTHRARARIPGEGGSIVNAGPEVKNIVLVHGGFVDGSGWPGVHDHLTADGYRVGVVQNPPLSLVGDVAVTHRVLGGLDGPAVLVGHSYACVPQLRLSS
jgi:pimeloyl-ACP methyl ester carboxylesterase